MWSLPEGTFWCAVSLLPLRSQRFRRASCSIVPVLAAVISSGTRTCTRRAASSRSSNHKRRSNMPSLADLVTCSRGPTGSFLAERSRSTNGIRLPNPRRSLELSKPKSASLQVFAARFEVHVGGSEIAVGHKLSHHYPQERGAGGSA